MKSIAILYNIVFLLAGTLTTNLHYLHDHTHDSANHFHGEHSECDTCINFDNFQNYDLDKDNIDIYKSVSFFNPSLFESRIIFDLKQLKSSRAPPIS